MYHIMPLMLILILEYLSLYKHNGLFEPNTRPCSQSCVCLLCRFDRNLMVDRDLAASNHQDLSEYSLWLVVPTMPSAILASASLECSVGNLCCYLKRNV